MRATMAGELEGPESKPIPGRNPNQWVDRTKSQIRFEYDAYGEVERCWTSGGREQMEALGERAGGDGAHHSSSVGMALKNRI